jgi:tripartite-type tricarboxylate transporter receptor subunit TctC
VRIVVPFPGGSATDTITRILAQSITPGFGQTMIVDNKPGADGAIAGAEGRKGACRRLHAADGDEQPDVSGSGNEESRRPTIRSSDFTPITDIGRYTFFLYVNSSVQAKTFQELVAYAKANPGKLAYATGNTTGSSRSRR